MCEKVCFFWWGINACGSHVFVVCLQKFAEGEVAADRVRVGIPMRNDHDVLRARDGFKDLHKKSAYLFIVRCYKFQQKIPLAA